jgi:hypothetical protein
VGNGKQEDIEIPFGKQGNKNRTVLIVFGNNR